MRTLHVEIQKRPAAGRFRPPTIRAILKLNRVLALKPNDDGLDWAAECSDSDKLPYFLDAYAGLCEDDDERYAMMMLILFSYEQRLAPRAVGHNEELWARICGVLRLDRAVHRDGVEYFACPNIANPHCGHELTPLMRELASQL